MSLPNDLAHRDWPNLEFLGWRDPKSPRRAYLVLWRGVELVGIALRAADAPGVGRPAMCEFCRSTHSAGRDVTLFAAARADRAQPNSVGTYICTDLGCSDHVRLIKPTSALRPAPGLGVDERVEGLAERLSAFTGAVLGSAESNTGSAARSASG